MKYIIMAIFALTFIAFQVNDADALMIVCPEDSIEAEKYPICEYAEEWYETFKYQDLVAAELALREDKSPQNIDSIYKEIHAKVRAENPGLYEYCEDLRRWIYDQLGSSFKYY